MLRGFCFGRIIVVFVKCLDFVFKYCYWIILCYIKGKRDLLGVFFEVLNFYMKLFMKLGWDECKIVCKILFKKLRYNLYIV